MKLHKRDRQRGDDGIIEREREKIKGEDRQQKERERESSHVVGVKAQRDI